MFTAPIAAPPRRRVLRGIMAAVPNRDRSLPPTGSSIATPLAFPWVTDFLNAAYYARDPSERDVADLRLAHGILTTRWSTHPHRRLGARDLRHFHAAFGRHRLPSGRLGRDELLAGAVALLGDWFPEAWHDDARRAHGIAFRTAADRERFDPAARTHAHARVGALTPPRQPEERRRFLTYEPVPLASAEAALRFLSDPARWPDMGSALGRFTAIRPGGLEGQTFEIELEIGPAERLPAFVRSYVTCTAVLEAGPQLDALVGSLATRLPELAEAGELRALVELTTHARHPLGAATSRLLIASGPDGDTIRDIGCWDPLPFVLQRAYDHGGHAAQVDFWGAGKPASSMLAQLAAIVARES
jgi:hypothetical protein